MKDSLRLATLGGVLAVEACSDRWRVAPKTPGVRLTHPEDWPREWLDSVEAWRLSYQLGHLIDTGVAVAGSDEISIPWSEFGNLDRSGFSLPLLWSEWSPFRLSVRVEPANWSTRFFLGGLEVSVERAGRFVRRVAHSQTFLLDEATFQMLELMERGPRSGDKQWIDLGFLSAYTFETCATVSGWLAENDVLFPAAMLSDRRDMCLRTTLDTFIAEVDRRAFLHALNAQGPGTRRVLIFTPGRGWQHVVLDDLQVRALDEPSTRRDAPSQVTPHAGRIGTRQAEFFSHQETLPVRLRPVAPLISWHPPVSKRYGGTRTITRGHIESLAAADFAVRGYETIVLPRNCWTGASLIAISERDVFLVRIETGECGEEALRAAVRMLADHQRICARPYRVAIAALKGCDSTVRRRADIAGIQILDRRGMLDTSVITEEHIVEHERRRCRSVREAVEFLVPRTSDRCF